MKSFIVIVCVLFSAPSWAAGPGHAVKSCPIMDEPFRDAKKLGSLEKEASVKIVKKKKGWLNIESGKKKGWVRMFCVRSGKSQGKPSAGTETKGVLKLASGRAGKGNVVAGTGVRGLSEEELKEAGFNLEEINKMESFSVSKKEAQNFAKKAGLVPIKVVAGGR